MKALSLLGMVVVSGLIATGCGALGRDSRRSAVAPSVLPRKSGQIDSKQAQRAAELDCEPALSMSAAIRVIGIGDGLDMSKIGWVQIQTDLAVEKDAKQRDDLIRSQVGPAQASEAQSRFRSIWKDHTYQCTLQEVEAECMAEVPEHSCAVLVGMYTLGSMVERQSTRARDLIDRTCSRGSKASCFRIGALFEQSAPLDPSYPLVAEQAYGQACDRGDPVSCDRLAVMQINAKIDDEAISVRLRGRADSLAQDLCEHGEPSQCHATALRYASYGSGVLGLEDRVREMHRTACSRGSAAACSALGECYEAGTCAIKSLESAAWFYRRACDLEHGLGCSSLGMLLENGIGLPKSPQQAVDLYARACDLGHAGGCNSLCWAKYEGRAVRRNLAEAAAACAKGCERDDSNSCTMLAWFHHVGAGVELNDNRAREIGDLACAGGDMEGCSNLGEILTTRKGVGRDEARAASLFRDACNAGSESGCLNLGMMTEMEGGAPLNQSRSREFYLKAMRHRASDGYQLVKDLWSFCAAKDPRACTLLGVVNREGVGTTRDVSRSVYFFSKGCSLGDEWGCAALHQLRTRPGK